MAEKTDYKSTMNLPTTDFPMRASLSQREPEQLEFWERIGVYRRSLEVNAGGELFILHDGPPYANGHIHMGTAFNKVFKDLIVKYKTMRGYLAPYVPGWDCHGQPIEHQVEKNLGPEKMKTTTQAELRALCREYAMKFVGVQAEEFKRLGVRGDFEDPYLTLNHAYEAGNVRIFKAMFDRGMIYKGAKPIHWCVRCKTALAEAEIEYSDETSDSIYVKFEFTSRPELFSHLSEAVSIVIWTTTPWTLPANVAVTLADAADYVGVRVGGEVLVMAEALVTAVAAAAGWSDYEVLPQRVKGADLAGLHYRQPIHEGVEGASSPGTTWSSRPGRARYTRRRGTARTTTSSAASSDSRCPCPSTTRVVSTSAEARSPGCRSGRRTRSSSNGSGNRVRWWQPPRSRTATRTAGAASVRSSSAPRSSGS
jgi:isoleucyl-tRNA synthetase